jgi:hypothetical protein
MRLPAHISTAGRLRYSDATLRMIASSAAAAIVWEWVACPSASKQADNILGHVVTSYRKSTFYRIPSPQP